MKYLSTMEYYQRQRLRRFCQVVNLLSLSVIFLGAIISTTCCSQNPHRGTFDKWTPPAALPMSRDKPPTLPSGSYKVMQADDEYLIESPEFRKMKYPNLARNVWRFQADGCNMGINCPDFQLTEFRCLDRLEVIDNANGRRTRYCGLSGPKEAFLSDNVTIIFSTSARFSDVGFRCRMMCTERKYQLAGAMLPKIERNTTNCRCGSRSVNNVSTLNPAATPEYLWSASLVRKGDSRPFCRGALINSRYVISSAHCLDRHSPSRLEVVFNQTRSGNSQDGNSLEVRRGVESTIIHKEYSSSELDFDVGLIRLSEEVNLSGNMGYRIIPACLPTEENIGNTYAGENATIFQWETGSGDLEERQVTVLSNEQCKGYYADKITERMLCTDTQKFLRTCQGDSGEPLFFPKPVQSSDSGESSQRTLIGLASWGYGCGLKPNVYTRITALMRWIAFNAKDGSYCSS